MTKKLLITGGAGFIGLNFINYLLKKSPELKILNIDKLTYAAHPDGLELLKKYDNFEHVSIDLFNFEQLSTAFKNFNPDGILHFAAESHVDRSIISPRSFVESNINGTFNLLELCREHWKNSPEKRFHHVSTDEVFGEAHDNSSFSEKTPYNPRSPYSASKAASDHLVRAFHYTYGLNTTLSNCSNNFGPWQHSEKLIPTVIRTALAGKQIPVYGQGTNIRDWLYVTDHCEAIDLIFNRAKPGSSYNIGTRNEWKNIDLVQTICKHLNQLAKPSELGDYTKQIAFVNDRPGHDLRYSIDPSLIETELGWKPKQNFDSALKETIQWYLSK